MTEHDVPRRRATLVHEVAASDETVVYDEAGKQLVALNPTAAAVWYLIDGSRSVAAIVDLIVESVSTDRATVTRDVTGFLADLDARGLLEWARDPFEG
jgi:hypothetical protein